MREAADEPELRFAVVEALEKVPGLQAQEAEQAVAGRPRRQRQRLPPAARGALGTLLPRRNGVT
ncbi:MAG: hypothetical protein ACJ75R_02115 [Solirubrobacterales bacterium]